MMCIKVKRQIKKRTGEIRDFYIFFFLNYYYIYFFIKHKGINQRSIIVRSNFKNLSSSIKNKESPYIILAIPLVC